MLSASKIHSWHKSAFDVARFFFGALVGFMGERINPGAKKVHSKFCKIHSLRVDSSCFRKCGLRFGFG